MLGNIDLGPRIFQAKAWARPTVSLRTVSAEHTLQGVNNASLGFTPDWDVTRPHADRLITLVRAAIRIVRRPA